VAEVPGAASVTDCEKPPASVPKRFSIAAPSPLNRVASEGWLKLAAMREEMASSGCCAHAVVVRLGIA
jgi:hypothetical protein